MTSEEGREEVREETESGLGILRMEIRGNWNTLEFGQLLESIRKTYLVLNAFEFFTVEVERENWTGSGKPPYFTNLYLSEPLDFLVSVAHRHTGDLFINAINYNSPGWLELIANLNPLKHISDGISNWRGEDTERTRIRSIEKVEIAKIKAGLAQTMIEEGKPLREIGTPQQFERLLEAVDASVHSSVSDIATNGRIGQVLALPPDQLSMHRDASEMGQVFELKETIHRLEMEAYGLQQEVMEKEAIIFVERRGGLLRRTLSILRRDR